MPSSFVCNQPGTRSARGTHLAWPPQIFFEPLKHTLDARTFALFKGPRTQEKSQIRALPSVKLAQSFPGFWGKT
jgi:hypothetical protein